MEEHDVQLGVICIECSCGRRSWRRDTECGFRPLQELQAQLRCEGCGRKGACKLSRPVELIESARPHEERRNYTVEQWDEAGDRPDVILASAHDFHAAQFAYLGARIHRPTKPMMLRQWARVVSWSRRESIEETGRRVARLIAMAYLSMKPVTIWETNSTRRTLTDVERAAEFLLIQWPRACAETDLHRAARIAALEALAGRSPAEDFRTAFVAAAKEADVLVEG